MMLSKVYRQILVSFGLVKNFEISDLAMAEFEKVNIAIFELHDLAKTASVRFAFSSLLSFMSAVLTLGISGNESANEPTPSLK